MNKRLVQRWWWGRDSLPMWVGVGTGLFVLTILGYVVAQGYAHGAFR